MAESLIVWRSKEPPTSEALARFQDLIAPFVVGSADLTREWKDKTMGTVIVDGDAPDVALGEADLASIPFPRGYRVEDESAEIEAPSLPAPPLALKSRHPVSNGFELRFSFEAPLQDHEQRCFEDLCDVFSAAYDAEDDGPSLIESNVRHEDDSFFVVRGEGLDELALRGHAYWFVEFVDRFFDLNEAGFVGDAKTRSRGRGLKPSWLGPVVVMGASLAAGRFVEGPVAVRASVLAWLFLPLVFTFLSRQHVGRLTWVAAFVNALGQAAAAAVLEDPTMLWPPPTDLSALISYHAELESRLVFTLYAARALGLIWVAPYLISRNRRV